jgi:hypothetical protein
VLSELLFDTTFSQSLVQDLESNSYDIFLGRVKVILVFKLLQSRVLMKSSPVLLLTTHVCVMTEHSVLETFQSEKSWKDKISPRSLTRQACCR